MKILLNILLLAAFLFNINTAAIAAGNLIDVPTTHWAYGSVQKLIKAGVVEGYRDGYFKGDKPLNRYEFTVAVAKAIDNYSKADEANKTEILKLIAEFSKELDKIGARLGALEKNQPNLKFSGNFLNQYTSQNYPQSSLAKGTGTKDTFRLRLDGTAKVDDKTKFGLRIVTGGTTSGKNYTWAGSTMTTFGGPGNTGTGTGNTTNTLELDRLFTTRNFGNTNVTLGRQKLAIGADNFIVDSGAYSFDGLSFAFPLGTTGKGAVNWGRAAGTSAASHLDVASLEASNTVKRFTYGAGYAAYKDNGTSISVHDLAKYTYLYGQYNPSDKIALVGQYVKNRSSYATSNNSAYTVGILLGNQNRISSISGFTAFKAPAKAGDQNISLKYFNVGKNSISRYSNYTLSAAFNAAATDAIGPNAQLHNADGLNIVYTYFLSPSSTVGLQYYKLHDKENAPNDNLGTSWKRITFNAYF